MAKRKRKLTPAAKAEKKRRKAEYMMVFINGKQKRVKRPQTIDGVSVDEFTFQNADPIWLHQNEMWEYIKPEEDFFDLEEAGRISTDTSEANDIQDLPF